MFQMTGQTESRRQPTAVTCNLQNLVAVTSAEHQKSPAQEAKGAVAVEKQGKARAQKRMLQGVQCRFGCL